MRHNYFGTLEINLTNQTINNDFTVKISITFNEILKFNVLNLYTNKPINSIFHPKKIKKKLNRKYFYFCI